MFVVRENIHVVSGQLHLANAPPLSLMAAADLLCASVKWTVNIDRETAGGEERPCPKEMEMEGDDRGEAERRERKKKKGEFLPMPPPLKKCVSFDSQW